MQRDWRDLWRGKEKVFFEEVDKIEMEENEKFFRKFVAKIGFLKFLFHGNIQSFLFQAFIIGREIYLYLEVFLCFFHFWFIVIWHGKVEFNVRIK